MERIKRVNRAPTGGTLREPEDLAIAMLLAAERVGEDGHGRNGVVGYFTRIGRAQPIALLRLLVRVELDQNVGEDDEDLFERHYETVEEAREALREHGYDLEAILGEGSKA
jgi:hypothetical protein